MKSLLNSLLAISLSSSPICTIASNSINLELNNTNYQKITDNYEITPNNNKDFKKWLNPNSLIKKEESWDEYLHQININDQLKGVVPKAEIGGGIYLNLTSIKDHLSTKGSSILNSNKAIGSYSYTKLASNNETNFGNLHKLKPSYKATSNTAPVKNPFGWTSNYGKSIGTLTKSNDDLIVFLQKFLTNEINYWYYKTFSHQLQSSLSAYDYQSNVQKYTKIHNFFSSHFQHLINLEFGGQYNTDQKIVHYYNNDKLKTFLSIASLLSIFIPKIGDLLGMVSEGLSLRLDAGSHDVVHYKSVSNSFRFSSQSWTLEDIDNIMKDILGDGVHPFPKLSAINDFIQKNHIYPDNLSLDHFSYGVNPFSASAYWKEIDTWKSIHIHDGRYFWHKFPGLSNGYNKINLSKLEPFLKFNITAVKSPPNYSREKKILSDPHSAPQKDPILLPTGGADKILPNEWDKDQVSYTLNSSWSSMGGLDDGLDSYATYKKVTIIKGKPVLCEMYLPKLGFTKENPVYFYVKGI